MRVKLTEIFFYLQGNKIVSLVAAYMLFSVILKLSFDADIGIPCLWKTLFGFECPGCGLTTAFIKLLQLDVSGAYKSNWLIFIVVPAGSFYILSDYNKFRKEYRAQQLLS